MKFLLLTAILFICPASFAQETPPTDDSADDSYINPETLEHRSGYTRRADQASAANTVNQLEEDDRKKSPVIRFPRIDAGLEGWYAMKRRLNEQSGIQFGFDYNMLYQSANKALTADDSAWSGVFRVLGAWGRREVCALSTFS